MIQVTPSDVTDENQLSGLEAFGKIELLSVDEVTTSMERGENVTRRQRTEMKELPKDYYKLWVSSK